MRFKARPERAALRERLAWRPVPLALTAFLIAGAQVGVVTDARDKLAAVLPLSVVHLLAAALLAKALARAGHLPAAQGRTRAFGFGTRNSFVMLPFALTLPAGWEAAALVVVAQSLLELFGMVFPLWWIPRRMFRH